MAAAAAPARVVSPAAVRAARLVAWSIWLAGLGLRIAQLVLAARIPEEGVRLAWGVGLLAVACATVFGFAQATVGALIVGRRPRNVIGWLLVASGLAQGFLGAATSWSSIAIGEGLRGPAILVGTVASIGIQAVPLFVVTLVLLIFPDGRLASRRWGWVLVIAVVGLVLRSAEVTWGPPDVFLYPAIRNPYVAPAGLGPLVEAAYGLGLGYRILQVAVTLASVSLWLRYRRADPQTRLQLRWFFWAAAILGVMALPFAYVNVFVPRTETGTEWAISLLFLGFALPSVAIFVAITRYRLYEIDRIINRAVLYGSLTAILAGLFTAGIGLAQRVFVLVTHSQSDAAIVLTTFVVATTYAPIRKWLEGIVDRRFKYDRARFGGFTDEISRVLAVLDPEASSRRLCEAAVRELEAVGAAVTTTDGAVVASAGAWPAETAARLGSRAETDRLLQLGPRRDGRPHDATAIAELEALVDLLGRAHRLAARPATSPAAPASRGRGRAAR